MKKKINMDEKVSRSINITLRVTLLFGLLYLCFMIIRPFFEIGLWALIIAVTIYPFYDKLVKLMNNHNIWAAVVLTVLMLSIIVVPGEMFVQSAVKGVIKNASKIESENFTIPLPDPKVKNWPFIGNFVYDKWKDLSRHTVETLSAYSPRADMTEIPRGISPSLR